MRRSHGWFWVFSQFQSVSGEFSFLACRTGAETLVNVCKRCVNIVLNNLLVKAD